MTLTSLVRKLERQLKTAEKLARHYDTQAKTAAKKLLTIAGALGMTVTRKPAGRKKRKMSAAGRKRIAAAQKKRWAKIRAKKKQGRKSQNPF